MDKVTKVFALMCEPERCDGDAAAEMGLDGANFIAAYTDAEMARTERDCWAQQYPEHVYFVEVVPTNVRATFEEDA